VVAHVPFLCDIRRAARTDGALIRTLLEKAKMNDEQHLRVLDYFDPLNLVTTIKSPVLMSSGGKDTVCPAETVRAVFDRVRSTKALFHEPNLPHTSSEAFYKMMWGWLDSHLR
jgi:cephalosporin-C deacetylase